MWGEEGIIFENGEGEGWKGDYICPNLPHATPPPSQFGLTEKFFSPPLPNQTPTPQPSPPKQQEFPSPSPLPSSYLCCILDRCKQDSRLSRSLRQTGVNISHIWARLKGSVIKTFSERNTPPLLNTLTGFSWGLLVPLAVKKSAPRVAI